MKNYLIPFLVFSLFWLTGCESAPNLVVGDVSVDIPARNVEVEVKNIGNEDAGTHLVYIEINEVGAADALKPQSQYSANISSIPADGSWNSGPILFSNFSSPRGLDLSTLTSLNLVVRADAQNMVQESTEGDNI